ncbi:hypothetical protein [Vibrio aestuarianus]|uniref:hypothetical protein n=1 Tax=Vibrio aestuarianus TaxID=28171 RepID=UPI00237CDDFF|nr:hypothetical protein [Vibrio aestuarianus]MDE1340744.1 hypothetical protein [Vibrio aestuarianus]
MAVQPIVSSPNITQPSSDGLDLQACDSILGQTSSPMPLGSASGLPDSTCPGESLLESDNRVSKEVRKKIKRTSNTHTGSNKYSNRDKAEWHVASMLAATALGLVLAPLTAGASLFPTIGALVIINSVGICSYGGRTFYMATPENGKTSEKEHAPPATLEGAPDDEGQKGTTQDRNAPGYSDPVYIFIDNSRIITNNGSSSAASQATGEGVGISVNTQTSDEFFSKLSQVGVEVTTQPMTADQLRAFITSSTNKSELVDRLLDNHALNGDTVIIAQVSDPNIGILRAVITVPNELLPHDAPSAESQTLIPQAAQLDASGGWIRDENGWRELKETPPVFTTQGSTSARDAMWRRSSVEDSKSSTGASRLSPQNSVSAAGISKPVTSFTNSFLSNQSAQPQVAQLGASGGWIRDKNGWKEPKEIPRVFATQGSTSARDAMWRNHSAPVAAGSQNTLPGSLLKSGVDTPIVTTQDATSSRNTSNTISRRSVNVSKLSTGASRLSPQNSVSAAGIPQPVTSLTNTPSSNNAQLEQSVEKHYEVHIPAPILTTEGTISNYSRGLFNNVKDIEEIRKQIRHQLYLEDYRTLAALTPIAGGGNRNNLVAAPVNMQNLVKESSV